MRRHKYNAVRTEYNGKSYPSKGEARFAENLDLRLKCNDIEYWTSQVRIQLGPDFSTHVDFMAYKGGEFRFYEYKGRETPRFRKIRKLWKKYIPFPLYIVTAAGSGGFGIEKLEGKTA